METIDADEWPQDVYTLPEVDPNIMHGNLLTHACELSRVEASEPTFDWTDMKALLSLSAQPGKKWFDEMLTREIPRTDKNQTDEARTVSQLEILLSRFFDGPTPVANLNRLYQKFLWALLSPPEPRSDFGRCLMKELVENESHTYLGMGGGVLPATGYEKPLLESNLAFTPMSQMYLLPHPASSDVEAAAMQFLRLDNWRISSSIFIKDTQTPEHKDKIKGVPKLLLEMLLDYFAYFNLQRVSGMRLLSCVHARARAVGRAEYIERYGDVDGDVALFATTAEDEFYSLPAHPYVTYMENLFKSGKTRSEVGTHDATWVHKGYDALEKGRRPAGDCSTDVDSTPFIALYGLHLQRTALRRYDPSCMSRAWGWEEPPRGTMISPVEFMSALKADKDLVPRMKRIAAALGWGNIPADVGELNFNGPNFSLCDGIHVSSKPDAVAAGLVPNLSLGNRKARGIVKRVDLEFTPEDQKISVVPLRGIVHPTSARDDIERRYIPASMVMDEEDVETAAAIMAGSIKNALALASIEYWRGKATKYLPENYRDLDPATLVPAGASATTPQYVHQSHWDPFGYNRRSGSGALMAAWVAAIIPQALPFGDGNMIAKRKGGQLFYGRSIAALAITDELMVMKKGGTVVITLQDTQAVVFNNKFELRYDMAELDKLLVLTPAHRTGAKDRLGLTTFEVAKAAGEP